MKTLKSLLAVLILLVPLGTAATALGQSLDPALAPEKSMDGTIQALDFGANSMVFEGLTFSMAPELEVQIRGSYGAFTMLQEGMKASIVYRVVSGSARVVTRIEQLPDNFQLEGA